MKLSDDPAEPMKLQTEQINDRCFKLLHWGWFAMQQWCPEDSLIWRSRMPSKQNVKTCGIGLAPGGRNGLGETESLRSSAEIASGCEKKSDPI